MAWVDLSSAFTFGSQLTSTQMQQLRDNLTALANGDSGAPSIQTAALADYAVTSAKVGNNAILTIALETGAVTNLKIGDLAVSTAKLQDEAVTNAKLGGSSVLAANIDTGAVTTIKIADLAVTSAKLAASAVATANIANYAVTGGKIASLTITGANLAADAVDYNKLHVLTASTSGSLAFQTALYSVAHAHCFGVNMYSAGGYWMRTTTTNVNTADYVRRWGTWNDSSSQTYAYTYRWAYVTATDNPFIYALQDRDTGEIVHLWEGSDPPFPDLWDIDELPETWERPIIMDGPGAIDVEEMVLFKYPLDKYREIEDRFRAAPKETPAKILGNEFDFDSKAKLFKRKNLLEI